VGFSTDWKASYGTAILIIRIRARHSVQVFPELAEEGTSKQMTLFGHLGDQDVWNFHLIRHPEVRFSLPVRQQ
jgi:hypothetical protein